jgi:hypothetical protein
MRARLAMAAICVLLSACAHGTPRHAPRVWGLPIDADDTELFCLQAIGVQMPPCRTVGEIRAYMWSLKAN